jgi:hypothetical protein
VLVRRSSWPGVDVPEGPTAPPVDVATPGVGYTLRVWSRSQQYSAIEAKAKRLGLSRTEYLRRQMLRVAWTSDEPVSVESLRQFARTFADLGDPEVMRGAWE